MTFADQFYVWLESRAWKQDVNAHQFVSPDTQPPYIVWEAENQPLAMTLNGAQGVQPKNVRLFVWGGPHTNGSFVDDGQLDAIVETIRDDMKTYAPGPMGTGWVQGLFIESDEADVDTPPTGGEDAAPYRMLDMLVWYVPA